MVSLLTSCGKQRDAGEQETIATTLALPVGKYCQVSSGERQSEERECAGGGWGVAVGLGGVGWVWEGASEGEGSGRCFIVPHRKTYLSESLDETMMLAGDILNAAAEIWGGGIVTKYCGAFLL